MSKITPVRWWRDDETRYRSRPPYVVPPTEVGWAFEPLARPLDPEFTRMMQRMQELASPASLAAAGGIPLDILNAPGSYSIDEDRSTSDPRFATGWRSHLHRR